MKRSKIFGLLVLLMVYLVATCIGLLVAYFIKDYFPMLITVLISDVIATIVVWFFGVLFKTASMYDPYWSVQTIIIYLTLLIYYNNFNLFTIIPLIAIGIYSIRLTLNFIIGFDSLSYVDWRYKMLAKKTGKFFQLVNLTGICIFPTLVVYSASIPLFIYSTIETYSYIDIIGSFVILLGTLLELISDIQMKKFIKTRTSRQDVINVGLWRYSRHPNYLGEVIIWFGVAFILIFNNVNYFYTIAGAMINLLMFIFISIPMEERHMKQYKTNLDKYIASTSPLLILPRRKID